MSSMPRQFRSLGISLAVLAISAGAVFAAAPSLQLTSNHGNTPGVEARRSADPSESAAPRESAEPSAAADATESPEPRDAAVAATSAEPASSLGPKGSPNPSAGTHGSLVSTAAQMPTPTGFPNHGAFVSCVAHLNVSPTGFDWTTVTPESCGITPAASAQPNAVRGHGHGNGHGNNGHGHGATGH